MKIERILADRRRMLKGMLGASAVSVGLPILDAMLNENGNAFAATGKELPTRFCTWFWGLGVGEGEWQPKTAGTDWEMPRQFRAMKPLQKKVNLYSGGQVLLEGGSNTTHFTGVQGLMTGTVSGSASNYYRSLDTIIGDAISQGTRFRSIEVACNGDAKATWSARETGGRQPAEVSPLALYARIFGPEFKDPNAADFVPDPQVMVRKSALSAVSDQRQRLMSAVGASDRAKLDNYFTSLRSLEQKLEIQLQKPEPLPACVKPGQPEDKQVVATLATDAMRAHDIFAALLAHALACGQTRVTNLCVTQGMSGLRREGDSTSHHSYTHEEPVDPVLGYQVKCDWFQSTMLEGMYTFAKTLDSIQEGDKTLLDRSLVFAFTDHGAPRLHSVRNYPVLTIGSANGRMKTGIHVAARGDLVTRVGFTAMQAMGVGLGEWGTGGNRVTRPYTEVLTQA
jgi:hypothetical protein